jgi:hypothetical protein
VAVGRARVSWRSVSAVALGLVFAAAAVYWFTIGRRPLQEVGDAELGEVAG